MIVVLAPIVLLLGILVLAGFCWRNDSLNGAQAVVVLVMVVLLLGCVFPGPWREPLTSIVGISVLGGAVVLLLGIKHKRKRTKYLFLPLGLVVLLLCAWSWLRVGIGLLVLSGTAFLFLRVGRKPSL